MAEQLYQSVVQKDVRDLLLRKVENNRIFTLRKSKDFLRLKEQGKYFSINSWLAMKYMVRVDEQLHLGWTIPAYVGTAVVRNRLKRWIREYLKTLKYENPGIDVNFILRRKSPEFFRKIGRQDLYEALDFGFKRLRKMA